MSSPHDAKDALPPVDAQCASCGLSPLIAVSFCQDEDGAWVEEDDAAPATTSASTRRTIQIDACPVCNGAWFDAGELDSLSGAGPTPGPSLESALGEFETVSSRACPRGHGVMGTRTLTSAQGRTPVERCVTCRGIWLDGHERARFARKTTAEGQRGKAEDLARRGAIWAIQLLTQLPVEVDNPQRETPWVVYGLLGILGIFFGLQTLEIVNLEDCEVIRRAGAIPGTCLAPVAGAIRSDLQDHGLLTLGADSGWTLLTSVFLHGTLAHLLGNMYFLYIFGDNVESLFGRLRFVGMFFLASLVGVVTEIALTTATADPIVGASGGIAGVMAAYLWCFPRNKLFQMILFIQVKLPAWTYLVFWIGFQAAMGLFSTGGHVAWFSHIAGFCTGLAVTPLVLRWRRRTVARAVSHPATHLL